MSAEPSGGGIVVIGGGISLLTCLKEATKLKTKVTAVLGNAFLEWPMMAPYFLGHPEVHKKFVCGDPKDFMMEGIDYIFDGVTEIVPAEKKIKFLKHEPISYSAVIVATGNKLPLMMPTPGDSLQQRIAEVHECAAAVRGAKTIIVSGPGAVGVEVVSDFRTANPSARIILLSRSGKVVDIHPEYQQELVKKRFKERNIELIKGTIKDFAPMQPVLKPGKIMLTGTEQADMEIEYDVFFPAFQQGPNTTFLADAPGVLNERRQINANESLQSTVHPELFAVGVSTVLANKHPISQSVSDQAVTAAKNAKNFLDGKPLAKHVPKGADIPMNICVGHDEGGYLIWDKPNLPLPMKCCCCIPCGCGYPCCPPPCCWCKPGCSGLCGNCCNNGHSTTAALFHTRVLQGTFATMRGYKGLGKAPTQQSMVIGSAE